MGIAIPPLSLSRSKRGISSRSRRGATTAGGSASSTAKSDGYITHSFVRHSSLTQHFSRGALCCCARLRRTCCSAAHLADSLSLSLLFTSGSAILDVFICAPSWQNSAHVSRLICELFQEELLLVLLA